MEKLININRKDGNNVVSARELYSFLNIKADFTDWCKRMFKYGFIEDVDFTTILGKSSGGRPSVDYALTLDTAKEISMLQRSVQGKKARQYFIECEKELKKPMNTLDFLQHSLDMMRQQDVRINAVEQKVNLIEAKTATRPDYFTIVGYGTLNGISVNLKVASALGRMASNKCKNRNLLTDTIPDARFGLVKMYPKQVLDEVFSEYKMSS